MRTSENASTATGQLCEVVGIRVSILGRLARRQLTRCRARNPLHCSFRAAGSARRDLIGKRISTELEQIMEDRAIYRAQGSERSVYVTDTLDRCCAAIAAPIISEGDALGLVLFVENEGENHVGETEYKLAQTIASFLGRHMES